MALQRRDERARQAGRQHHGTGAHRAARGHHLDLRPGGLQRHHGRPLDDSRARRLRRRQQAATERPRVVPSRAVRLERAAHALGLRLRRGPAHRQPHGLDARGRACGLLALECMRALRRTGQRHRIAGLQVGGDVEAAHEGTGIERRPAEALIEASCRSQAVPLLQIPERDARRLHNPACIEPGRRPCLSRLDERDANPGARELTRHHRPRQPAADDGDVGLDGALQRRPCRRRPKGLTIDPERGAIAGSRHRNAGRARRARGRP